MHKRPAILFILFSALGIGSTGFMLGGSPEQKERLDVLREGDIVFQNTGGEQGQAVQLATGSPWTHVGILYKSDGQWMVHEAVGPVKHTPLNAWTAQGEDGHWTAKRWVEARAIASSFSATPLGSNTLVCGSFLCDPS